VSFEEQILMSKDKYPSIMYIFVSNGSFMFIILEIFSPAFTVLKLGKDRSTIPQF